jgi:hypothetical protein
LIYELSIPFLSSAIPIRVVFLFSFAMSVLSAIGVEWWIESKDKKKTLIGTLPVVLIVLSIFIFTLNAYLNKDQIVNFPQDWHSISLRNLLIPGFFLIVGFIVVFLGQFFPTAKNILGKALILLLFFHGFLFAHKYIAFSKKDFLYPMHPLIEFLKENQKHFRYWGYGSAALPNNFATVYKIYSPEGYDPVNIQTYNELLSSSRHGRDENVFSRSDTLLFPAGEFPPKNPEDPRYRIMDMLGVKYVGFEKSELEKIEKDRINTGRYVKVWEDDHFIIFRNTEVYDRAYLVGDIINKGNQNFLNKIYDKDFNPKESILLEEPLSPGELIRTGDGRAEISEYSPNLVKIDVISEGRQMLVLSDAYFPGWKAYVGGQESKIHRVNHALRGVIVPDGESTVVFSYEPLSFRLGAGVTIISLLTMGIIALLLRRNRIWR